MSKVMKKNLLLLFNCVNYIELKHIIRIMKITTVLTLIAVFQLSATTLHSQNAKVSISRNNLPLKEFIQEIEKQTDYLFMYSEKEINLQEEVHVNAKNKPVSTVLEEVFGNSKIAYNFNEGYISLRKAEIEIKSIKHDHLIARLDSISNLYEVIVIKTELAKPYTSTFFELDCKYWDNNKQTELNKKISSVEME